MNTMTRSCIKQPIFGRNINSKQKDTNPRQYALMSRVGSRRSLFRKDLKSIDLLNSLTTGRLVKIRRHKRLLKRQLRLTFRLKSLKLSTRWRSIFISKGSASLNLWESFAARYSQHLNGPVSFTREVGSGYSVLRLGDQRRSLWRRMSMYNFILREEGLAFDESKRRLCIDERLMTARIQHRIDHITRNLSAASAYTLRENSRRARRSKRTKHYQSKIRRYENPLSTRQYRYLFLRWSRSLVTFKVFTNYSLRHLFETLKSLPFHTETTRYALFFNFRGNRLFVNLQDALGRNYFSLTLGLFLKFFKGKRSLKKNKAFKFLLIKYLRKLLIVANIKNINFFVKKTPLFFQELLSLLTRPLVRPFVNPLSGEVIKEMPGSFYNLNFISFIFQHTKSFSTQKIRKKGRIKRKIRRRLFRSNRVAD